MKSKNYQLSRNPDSLFEAFTKLDTEEDVASFLGDLCTPAEIEAFIDRWQAAKMIDQGMSYREITEKTGVSTATVTRVARFLHQGYGGYRLMLDKMKKT